MRIALIAYAIAILVIGALVTLVMTRETETEKAESEAAAEQAERAPAPLPAEITPGPQIAERVEQIRGQAFNGKAPAVQVVPDDELAKQLAALDEQPPDDPKVTAAGALLLAQAGALPAKQAPALAARRYGGTGVIAAYLPERRAVLVSEEFAADEPETAELFAAYELSRALDAGPAKDAPRVPPPFADDEAASVAVRAGAAALVERAYAREHLSDRSVDILVSREAREDPATPPLVRTFAAFPYGAGRAFMARVHERGGWKAVDGVLGDPPVTTHELLHRDADPAPAPDFTVKPVLGREYKRLGAADVGELDTIGLLRAGLGEDAARRAAAGWRAGRFEAWTRGGKPCPPPCRKQSASIVVWRFADEDASLGFVRAMRRALVEGTAARPEGGRGFVIDDGGAALVRAGRFAALTFAPDAPTAGELASVALEG